MFKIGDVVKIKESSNIFYWYNYDTYMIISIEGDLCELYNLTIKEIDNAPIHFAHLELSVKEYRKLKLEKLSEENKLL